MMPIVLNKPAVGMVVIPLPGRPEGDAGNARWRIAATQPDWHMAGGPACIVHRLDKDTSVSDGSGKVQTRLCPAD